VEGIHSKRAEAILRMGKGASFLKEVKEVNEKMTIIFPLKVGSGFFCPSLAI
jgi:hypothetical protein